MQAAEKTVGQEAISHGVGVDHAPATSRKELDAVQRIMAESAAWPSAGGHHGSREENQRSDEVPRDNLLIDQIFVGQRIRFGPRRNRHCTHIDLLAFLEIFER